jgi:osomolarity two-component system phosphorelay intermediate protein YPD1
LELYPSRQRPAFTNCEHESNSPYNSQKKDLNQLSQLGHFLKGSSATLGLVKVRDHCEKIQNIGHQKDDKGEDAGWDEKTCLDKIEEIVKVLKTDYADAERRLKAFYHDVPRDT